MAYQLIIIEGNLGKEPETRTSNGGMAITKFSVAVGDREKDGDSWKDVTDWFNIVTFGKTAENCEKYLSKGKKVLVEGKIKQRTYEKKDGGGTGYITELLASRVVFLSSKDEGSSGARGGGDKELRGMRDTAKKAAKETTPAPDSFIDDDLPF